MENELILRVRNLRKRFGSNEVLKGINIDIYKGEVYNKDLLALE